MSYEPPPFSAGSLESICRVLGEAVTGSQLTRLLNAAGIRDVSGESTKWKRLYSSIAAVQVRTNSGKPVVAAIHAIMEPGRFSGTPDDFEAHRRALNVPLTLTGLELGANGRVARLSKAATTLDEAQERADSLGTELRRRNVHPDVLTFCRRELLQENYFHAVLEASKSLAEKIRSRSGLNADGAALVDEAFSLKAMMPPLAFNKLETEWDQSEHKGLAMLARGLFGTFRNPTAHAPRIRWATEFSEALDMLTLVSMLHRRLDAAIMTPAAPAHPQHSP